MTNHLDRFVDAQDGIFESVIGEIVAGRKRAHWMWFVFPQLRGLGRSDNSYFYGLSNLEEARSYLAHPTLGPRLEQATHCVLEGDTPSREIFGEIDQQKFVSCMTLFGAATSSESVFNRALRALSTSDEKTIEMLGEE